MRVICDPTLLLTRRGQVWLDRAIAHGCGSSLTTPSGFATGLDSTAWTYGGPFGPRSQQPPWTGPPPIALLDYRAFKLDRVASHLLEQQKQSVAEIWLGLNEGLLLAARRPRVLDELVGSGVQLCVTSIEVSGAGEMVAGLPHELAAALVRRVRFLCCQPPPSTPGRTSLRVFDLGWSARR